MVLDSFALLAYFQDEPGAGRVEEVLRQASDGELELCITVVNVGEVIYNIENRHNRRAATECLTKILEWPIELVDVDSDLALSAAAVKMETRMGHLDCFVVALAQKLDATIVTGDPDFKRVEDRVAIEWLSQA